MDEMIENWVKNCSPCQINQNMPNATLSHPWESIIKPWVRVHLDFAGPFLGKMYLIIVDSFTKCVEVHPINNIKTVSTLKCLRETFSVFGILYTLVTDNGLLFVSEKFETFAKKNGIKHLTTAPYHPSSNGLAERMVQKTIKKITVDKNVPISIALSCFFIFILKYSPNLNQQITVRINI